jgi:hypothetical protein
MESVKVPFNGIVTDFRGRALHYKDDWISGLTSGIGYVIYLLLSLIHVCMYVCM